MKRLKILFAALLIAFAFPIWRFLDLIPIVWPSPLVFSLAMFFWALIFIGVPLRLLTSVKSYAIPLPALLIALLSWVAGPLSNMATDNPEHRHCGQLTLTGLMYPLRPILTDAYTDDLEARNQLCWLRKMIQRVPEEFELGTYTRITHDKLMKPTHKYRIAMPLIAILIGRINFSSAEVTAPKNIYDALNFWANQYTDEIRLRNYPWWNWPHSSYIKFEYGLFEENWQKLIDSIVLEST